MVRNSLRTELLHMLHRYNAMSSVSEPIPLLARLLDQSTEILQMKICSIIVNAKGDLMICECHCKCALARVSASLILCIEMKRELILIYCENVQ
jgi:hypothetical protein